MGFIFGIIVLFEIFSLLALSANQKIGFSGMLSLSQAVFFGVGAYTTGIALTEYKVNYLSTILIVLIANTLIAFIFSFIAGKLNDLYFSLATLALQIIFYSVIYNWNSLTKGSFGIQGIKNPEIFGFSIDRNFFPIYGAFWIITILLFYYWFMKTNFFRMIQATRDDQIAVLSFGKNPKLFKTVSIIISSLIAGIAGNLFATYQNFIDPSTFTIDQSILILSIILIGGIGKISGAFMGALVYILIPEIIKFLPISSTIAPNLNYVLFGILLIVIVIKRPNGILGKKVIQ